MKTLLRLVLALTLSAVAGVAFAKPPETVFLFQNRKVVIAVPEGFGFASNKSELGIVSVEVSDPKEKVRLHLTFVPDVDQRFTSARGRMEFMNETFQPQLAGSVEKAMQFQELDPKSGAGTYCVFTDATLVGKTKLPAGEYLCATTGVKAWSGVGVVFAIFTNDTRTKEYQAILTLLRDSVQELPLTPLL